uniref:Uncharacterized protein n=1 Tax=Heterorhabditis bacteriophora TaxID=37862 RepID=A0A1I7X8X3_HETBA
MTHHSVMSTYSGKRLSKQASQCCIASPLKYEITMKSLLSSRSR